MVSLILISSLALFSALPMLAMFPIIAIKTSKTNYKGLINLGNRLFSSITGNANFTTPVPSMLALQTQITAVTDALATFGEAGNRGSHADYEDLRIKALSLYNLIKAEAAYVTATAVVASPDDENTQASIMMTSGFALKNAPQQQGTLQPVRDLRVVNSAELNQNEKKIEWRKPDGLTSVNNVKNYRILISDTPDFASAEQITVVSKTTYTYANLTAATQNKFFFVIPMGTAGDGAYAGTGRVTISTLS